jgi:hypothetical protein
MGVKSRGNWRVGACIRECAARGEEACKGCVHFSNYKENRRKNITLRSQFFQRQKDFIKKHLLLADEAFCADMAYAEKQLIEAARKELYYPITISDHDIQKALKRLYKNLTGVEV